MPNIKDIAKHAGVSVATVSRTLKKPDLVKKSTRDLVNAAITKLEYKPNALASGLRRQKSDSIVVVVPFIHNPFYSGIVKGIENVAHSNGYKVLLGESQNDQERLDSYAGMILTKEADSLILLGALLPSGIRNGAGDIDTAANPVIMACEYFTDYDIPNVRIDNEQAAFEATTHLIELGHSRVAKITGPMNNPLSQDRLKGYEKAMKAGGLTPDASLVAHGDFSVHSGYRAMQSLLAGGKKPTSVFCSNDEMALGAIKAIREQGLRVPQDISIVGFDNVWFAEFTDPPLTTVHQPHVEIGETTMRLMLDITGKAAKMPRQLVLPHTFIDRASTARYKG